VVPVELNKKSFNLPVKIIIDINYPNMPPYSFVNPTEEHIIKPTD